MNIKLVKKLCLIVLTALSITGTSNLQAYWGRGGYYGGYRGGGWGGYRGGWGPGIGFTVGIGGSPYYGGLYSPYYAPYYAPPVVASPARISRETEDYKDRLSDREEKIKDLETENRSLKNKIKQDLHTEREDKIKNLEAENAALREQIAQKKTSWF